MARRAFAGGIERPRSLSDPVFTAPRTVVGRKGLSLDSIDRTLVVWQPRAKRKLSPHDASMIASNMSNFITILSEWETIERRQKGAQEPREKHDQKA